MAIHFFDTYKREKVEFTPVQGNEVRMYNCGPTIHDFAHIGNFRAYVFADILRRWLEVSGYKVKQVMNITDIDDKTIRKSMDKGTALQEFTKEFRKAFIEDRDKMNILAPEINPNATDHVNEMVEMIQDLISKGHAYQTEEGSVYFKITSFPEYGALSGKKLEDLRIGERVTNDEYESKDDVRDFALWKAWDENDGDVFWETSLGKGRPGWHIECSAMSMKYLGAEFDIHTGGVDNIFPHHENEIAQSKCATGEGFARHWLHCEYLIVGGKKMSKSLGNFYTIRDLLEKGFRSRELRYLLAGTHYRTQLNFTLEGLDAARKSLQRIDEFHESWQSYGEGDASPEVKEAVDRAQKTFSEAMDDDLNVPRAQAALFNFIREVNSLAAQHKATQADIPLLESTWNKFEHALGFLNPFDEDSVSSKTDTSWIDEKIAARNEARKSKDWAAADAIRDELLEKGIMIKDGPEGTTWKQV